MKVRIYGKTECVNEPLSLTEMVAQLARVSNPGNSNNHQTADKLVRFLIRNQHWSPLEMADVILEIETTRDISHQMIRHRSMMFQEFSQRYALVEGQMVPSEFRLQDTKNRQNSLVADDHVKHLEWEKTCNEIFGEAIFAYNHFTSPEMGGAKEVVRKILPEGLTPTNLFMKGSLRSWLHYCSVRCHSSTQKEHREIATACRDVINNEFPTFTDTIGHMLNISDLITEYWKNVA